MCVCVAAPAAMACRANVSRAGKTSTCHEARASVTFRSYANKQRLFDRQESPSPSYVAQKSVARCREREYHRRRNWPTLAKFEQHYRCPEDLLPPERPKKRAVPYKPLPLASRTISRLVDAAPRPSSSPGGAERGQTKEGGGPRLLRPPA